MAAVETPCREYQGGRDGKGYGWKPHGPKGQRTSVLVHRWVMEQVYGPLTPDQVVMHRCDNPPCFRFDHLEIGTKGTNNTDRAKKGRNGDHAGERHGMAKLTAEQVREIRRRAADGERTSALAETFAVSKNAVNAIVARRNWKSVA